MSLGASNVAAALLGDMGYEVNANFIHKHIKNDKQSMKMKMAMTLVLLDKYKYAEDAMIEVDKHFEKEIKR